MMRFVFSLALALITASLALAAGGTSKIADKGRPVTPQEHWPKGLEEVLNDPARTDGWNSWFSEWPNDVSHYQFSVKSTDEVNALVAKFAKIKAEKLQLTLSPVKEPTNFGWVSKLPEGNKTPIIFSMGNQKRLDDWFARLPDGKFGVMEFEMAPVAVPPTLTLFVQNEAIDLDKLRVPGNVNIVVGYLPGNFHAANLKEKKPQVAPPKPAELDEATKKAKEKIEAYLAARAKSV